MVASPFNDPKQTNPRQHNKEIATQNILDHSIVFRNSQKYRSNSKFLLSDKWMNKMWYDHGRGHYSAVKRNEMHVCTTRQMSPKATMRKERSRPQRTIHLTIEDTYIYGEIQLMVPQAEGLGRNGEGNAHVLVLDSGSACTTREHTKPSYCTIVGSRHIHLILLNLVLRKKSS